MTRKAFVIGHPIAHSRSPLIHGHWLEIHGIEGSYEAIDVAPEAFGAFAARLRQGEFVGGNVTIPHKLAAYALCDDLDAAARTIGAVNTIVAGKGGRLSGSNTDMVGFLANLDQEAPGWDEGKGEAIVLGAGGAARAILAGLAARGFARIHILNRTAARAEALAGEFDGPVAASPLSALSELLPRAGLLVNTTSIGMHGTGFEDLDLRGLPGAAIVTDIVYTPIETPLLRAASEQGLRTVDGLGMLLHQAVPGFAAWFGVTPEVTPELRQLVLSSLEAT